MRLRGRRQSSNVEDRRGRPGGGGGGPVLAGGGIGTLVLVLLGIFLFGNPQGLIQPGQVPQQPGANAQRAAQAAPGGQVELSELDQRRGEFSSQVLALTEDVWSQLFPAWSQVDPAVPPRYQPPKMVLFSESTTSGCGAASSAMGPFYCPADQRVYLDTQFFDVMERRLNAPGDFAQAYVIAHEVGHHIQNLLGRTQLVERARRQLSKGEANQYSVRLELQADFLAGVLFHHSQKMAQILEAGDIEEGLRAAAAIGDDTLQKQATGRARQETFTHGSSEQRVRWFMLGLKTGDPRRGDDTFELPYDQL
ncbi:MAG: neutral zinc metallopeptidase [Planctomycetota bacterium]